MTPPAPSRPVAIFALLLLSQLVIFFIGGVIPFAYAIDTDSEPLRGPLVWLLPPSADPFAAATSLIEIISYWIGLGTTGVLPLVAAVFCSSLIAATLLAFSHKLRNPGARPLCLLVLAFYWLTPTLAGILVVMLAYAVVMQDSIHAPIRHFH